MLETPIPVPRTSAPGDRRGPVPEIHTRTCPQPWRSDRARRTRLPLPPTPVTGRSVPKRGQPTETAPTRSPALPRSDSPDVHFAFEIDQAAVHSHRYDPRGNSGWQIDSRG